MFPCHRGHTQAVPQVGNLSPCLSVKLSLNHLKPNPYQIQGFQLHLDQSHTHPSLKYAVNDATQGSCMVETVGHCLRLWGSGHTSSPGHPPSLNNSTIWWQEVSSPSASAHILWSKIQAHSLTTSWNTFGQMPSLSPQKPSNKSQTILKELCKLASTFTELCLYVVSSTQHFCFYLLLSFDLPSICMLLLKFLGYSLMEHPLIRISLWNMVY